MKVFLSYSERDRDAAGLHKALIVITADGTIIGTPGSMTETRVATAVYQHWAPPRSGDRSMSS